MTNRLTMEEQETIILFNRIDKDAEVFTYEPRLIAKLNRLCKAAPDVFMKCGDNGLGGFTYSVPKKLVNIRAPLPKKKLTDDERTAFVERINRTQQK